MLDESKLSELVPEEEKELDDINTWEEKADYCDENIGIDFEIDNIEVIESLIKYIVCISFSLLYHGIN